MFYVQINEFYKKKDPQSNKINNIWWSLHYVYIFILYWILVDNKVESGECMWKSGISSQRVNNNDNSIQNIIIIIIICYL